MSQLQRVYYWANLIINPVIVLLFLTNPSVSSETSGWLAGLAGGWILLSGLLNRRVRRFIAGIFAAAAAIGWFGLGLAALLLLIAVATIGLFIDPFYLWLDALIAVVRDRQR